MKATIGPEPQHGGELNINPKVLRYRKEGKLHSQLSIVDRDTGREVVIVRTYYPASTAYCCMWVHGPDTHRNGAGKAGGYGYHKESAAFADAVRDAGIDLDESIAGRGERAMEDAAIAIAQAVTGKRKFFTIKAHG